MAAMKLNAMRMPPERVFYGQLITPRKREHARFAARSVKSARLVRSRVAVKTVFSNESLWAITPGPIINLQPCYRPLPHDLAGKHSSFWLLFFNQLTKIFSGPIKMLYQCDFQMPWPTVVRETGCMAVSYVAKFVARNPEMPGPTGT